MTFKSFSKLASATSALAFLASAALASGPVDVPEPEIYVQPAPQFDWAGAYGGLSYSAIGTDVLVGPTPYDFSDETGPGIFVGYNWQSGNVVYGGELNYTHFEARLPVVVNTQRNTLELRARAGYAMDDVLVYGFVGAARSEFFGLTDFEPQNGYSFGLGVQAHVGRNMFIGVEAARRVVDATISAIDVESTIDTISLRLGYQF